MIHCKSILDLSDILPIIEEEDWRVQATLKLYLQHGEPNIFLNDDKTALLACAPIDVNKWNVHIYSLPEARGLSLKKFIYECAKYMYTNTPCTTLLNFVKKDDIPLRMFMGTLGSKKVGVIEDAGPDGIEILYSSSKCNFPELVEEI